MNAVRPFERLYSVNEKDDGPRLGLADFDGVPHVYRSIYLDPGSNVEEETRFELSPAPPGVLEVALEEWAIRQRWGEAQRAARDELEAKKKGAGIAFFLQFPLPQDAARLAELRAILEPALVIDPARCRLAYGEFRWPALHPTEGSRDALVGAEVRWTPVELGSPFLKPTLATREWTLFVVALATAVHALEEYFSGWQAWARPSLGIEMPTWLFAVMNLVLFAAALVFSSIGWRRPALTLVIPVATLFNAIGFHIVPSVVQRTLVPGVWSALLLYLPFSTWAILGAGRDGVSRRDIAIALAGGTALAIGVVLAARLVAGPLGA